MSKNLIQGIKSYLANTHRFFNYGSSGVNVLSNLYNASPVEVLTLQNGNVGIGTNVPMSALHVAGNIMCSNISVIGDFVTMNTVTSNTEQMVIENAGTGPALKVTQSGNNSVAEFYDKESGVALFVGNNGNVGIGTNVPLSAFHVNGITTTQKAKIESTIISTLPVAGLIEYDGNSFEASTTSNFRGILPCQSIYVLAADRVLLDSTATQNFFDKNITLTSGITYRFTANICLSRSAGVTTHTTRSLIGGTATYTSLAYTVHSSILAATTGSPVYVGRATAITAATIGISNASATENNVFIFDGILRVNVGGTCILQFSYDAAPGGAPTVRSNSWIMFYPIGTNTVSAAGDTWA